MTIAILEAALRSSVLVAVVWLLLRALRVRSPSIERTAWLAVLVASIVMPFAMNLDIVPDAVAPTVTWLPQTEIGAMTIGAEAGEWQRAILWIYLVPAGVLCLRQLLGLARLWRLRAGATRLTEARDPAIDVRASSALGSPATIFSTILVPADFGSWSAAEREAVLAHERSHVLNRDFYVQALAHLHRHVFWFNPLAWWLPERLSLLSEHVSDDAAITTMHERTTYAELLLSCARKAIGSEQAIAMARKTTLATRIERILDASSTPPRAAQWKHATIAALLMPVVAISATLQTKAAPRPASRATYFEPFAQDAGAVVSAVESEITLPKSNPARPLSRPVYPPASRRLGETGTVVLKLHVLEDGSVGDAIIERSTGYPSLDYSAMYESFRWKLDAGTVDGQPQRMWGQFAVTFKLSK
jgi:TonB family protein